MFWAFNRAASGKPDDWHYLPAIAAALRAVADQVVPKEWPTIEDYNEYEQGVAAAHIKYRNCHRRRACTFRSNIRISEVSANPLL
ncbi:MAG: hypothetical protein EBS78_11955 [Altererythrobacter sp.]|nr:hypothetical protein [Altererythrobacter sp.]